jgi:type I restriction enzyme R subunit
LLERLRDLIAPLDQWTEKETTRAEIEAGVLDEVFRLLPSPPFTDEEKQELAENIYRHVWQQSANGEFPERAA